MTPERFDQLRSLTNLLQQTGTTTAFASTLQNALAETLDALQQRDATVAALEADARHRAAQAPAPGESAEEPLFTLRAQDQLAAQTVSYWIRQAIPQGVNGPKLAGALRIWAAMEEWKTRPDRVVKLPD